MWNSIMLPVSEYIWIFIYLNSTNFMGNKLLKKFVQAFQKMFNDHFLYAALHILLHIKQKPFFAYFNISLFIFQYLYKCA